VHDFEQIASNGLHLHTGQALGGGSIVIHK
jgi:hypothetical protein